MIVSTKGRIARSSRAAFPFLIVAAAAMFLLYFPPSGSVFYPRCPIYSALHLRCPGCGGTRAIAALLHGHLAEALRENALITLLLPLAMGYGAMCYRRLLKDAEMRWPRLPSAVIYGLAALMTVFTVARNLSLR